MNYVPRDLMAEIIKLEYFKVAPWEGTYYLLRHLITSKLYSMDQIMEKCWQRLEELDHTLISFER